MSALWTFLPSWWAPTWEWFSGATAIGPRWLSLFLGATTLAVVAAGIGVALWPTGGEADE